MNFRDCYIISFLIVFIIPSSSDAELIYGIGNCFSGGWDFSDSSAVELYEGDLNIVYVEDPPTGFLMSASNGALITFCDSSYSELTTAPTDLSLYDIFMPAFLGLTYVILTEEGHFAKFRLYLFYPAPTFEYTYQTDNTRNFEDIVPVEETTWGRLKNLYK